MQYSLRFFASLEADTGERHNQDINNKTQLKV